MRKSRYKFNINKFVISAGLIAFFGLTASAQLSVPCHTLLKQKINPAKPELLLANLKRVACFGLDSTDLQIFNNGPMLGSMMVDYATKHKGPLTYSNLLDAINIRRQDTSYSSMRNLTMAQNTLEKTKGSAATWESSKKWLLIIGMPQSEMESFHQFVLQKAEKKYNYRQLVVYYQMKKSD